MRGDPPHQYGCRSAAPWRISVSTDAGCGIARRAKTGTRRVIPFVLFTHCRSHVEELNWSGMSTREYANALLLSPWALRKWRARFDDGEVAIDWRAHLHPSARPRLSTRTSDSTKEPSIESLLTTAPELQPAAAAARPRRNFTGAEKHAIVLETEQPGVTVSQVARS